MNEIKLMAEKLGFVSSKNPIKDIKSHALKKLDAIFKAGNINDIDDLFDKCCQNLNLVFEIIYEDSDLEEIIERFIKVKEFVVATCRDSFDVKTYGILFKLKDNTFVSIVDARGDKFSRLNFTQWHEIAHLLTFNDTNDLPFHRSIQDDPIEKLMDEIASEAAFYSNIFTPAFDDLYNADKIKFKLVSELIETTFPRASFISTLYKCVHYFPEPTILLECEQSYKVNEEKAIWLFKEIAPSKKLRVRRIIKNSKAHKLKIKIFRNIRVPENSIIYKTFKDKSESIQFSDESFNEWTYSTGQTVANFDIHIEAKLYMNKVLALLTIIE